MDDCQYSMAPQQSLAEKQCTKCKNKFPATLAYFHASKGGLSSQCISCKRSASRAYRALHREKARERSAIWRLQNRERYLEGLKSQYRKNREKYSVYKKQERQRLYSVWHSMVNRCHDEKNPSFCNYGQRGIFVCDAWRTSFESFLVDMGKRQPGDTLERIDNDGPYSPENCCWASRAIQSLNTRRNHFITFQGKTQTIAEWASETGIKASLLRSRVSDGWPVEKLFSLIDGRKTRWERAQS